MISKILFVLSKKQKQSLAILVFVIVIGSIFELIGVSLIMPLSTIATDPSVLQSNSLYLFIGNIFSLHTPEDFILLISIFLIFIYLLKNVYLIFMNYLQYSYRYKNEKRLALELLKFYVGKEYLFHTQINVADIQRNVSTDVDNFWASVFAYTAIFNEVLVCLMLGVYLFITDFFSTFCIVLLLTLFVFIFFVVFKKKSEKLGSELRNIAAIRLKWLLQTFGGIKEIKVCQKEDFFISNYERQYVLYVDKQTKQSMLSVLSRPFMEAICICGLLSVLIIRILNGGDVKKFVPVLAVFVVAAFRLMPSFNRITSYMSQIIANKTSVENVYKDFSDLKNTNLIKYEHIYNKDDIDFENIFLKNITFTYPNKRESVINHLNMTIKKNSSVAVIGPSGAGKTTLADILLGIIKPDIGSVYIDNQDIFDILGKWHSNIAYIPQTIYLIDDSIKNNIVFGYESGNIDMDRLNKVIHQAQLDTFINGLDNGVDTLVGDRGVRISGGQRQRIGIARALYRNPKLLVLDEATSALDNDTEEAVMDSIQMLHGQCTLIIIAHRLSTIRKCDYIYEIDNGKATLKAKESIFKFN